MKGIKKKYKENKQGVYVNIGDMKPNPNNPRKSFDKKELEELKASLDALGQLNDCLIDEYGYILIGHRRHQAAKELGWKTLRCDIQVGLSPFNKSATMVSSNATQVGFNHWEHREAIARIYWDEFLNEYPTDGRDKGYSSFARKMGLSPSHIKKIIEVSKGKNKKMFEKLKNAKIDANTVDEVLTAPVELRKHLTDVALQEKKKIRSTGKIKSVRKKVRAIKRKALMENQDVEVIDARYFGRWYEDIEALGVEFGDHLIEKGDFKSLVKLEACIRKNIVIFYNKLKKRISKGR